MSRTEPGHYFLMTKYQIDVIIVKIRKVFKLILPIKLTKWVRKIKDKKGNPQITLLDDDYPWMSPNIWNEIVNYYRKLNSPVIFEFGTGASTINHFLEMKNLEKAQYIGIENDPSWFWLVVVSLLDISRIMGIDVDLIMRNREQNNNIRGNIDVEINFKHINFLLKLRTSISEYVAAFDKPCDVVIIDGIARKECVQIVIHKDYLREGGLFMLMEAGRGSDKWWEGKLYGDNDYSPEVEMLLSFGGEFLDGNGVDNWPNCRRKSPKPTSYYCPLEAFKLIKPPKRATL